jgi:hypothetical protein
MAKYLKHYYVDGSNLSEYFTDKNMGPNGKTHPRLVGLDVKFWFVDSNGIDYCLSELPDSTPVTETNGLFVLTYQDWANEAETHFNTLKAQTASNSELLQLLDKTEPEVLAMTFDKTSTETMVASFNQLAPGPQLSQE